MAGYRRGARDQLDADQRVLGEIEDHYHLTLDRLERVDKD